MSNDSSQSLDSPTNEAVMARLLELENRTGYRMQQCNGQRRYWNPNWTGPPPRRGSEVFVGKIPRDLFEDEIVPVFEKVGRIFELRLMMDFSGYNRGYAFVTFANRADAIRAIEMLDNFEIRPGLKIGVCRSVDNCKLFVGSIPKDKSREEIKRAMSDITDDVSDVIVYPGPHAGDYNRGFAFVEYTSHRAAAMARRKLIPGRITLFGYEVAVDWADPESDMGDVGKDEATNLGGNIYVQNLKLCTSEFSVWSAFNAIRPGSIEKVEKTTDRDFSYVYFHKREDAIHAVKVMNGKVIDGQKLHVSLASCDMAAKRANQGKFSGNHMDISSTQNYQCDTTYTNRNLFVNQFQNCMQLRDNGSNLQRANSSELQDFRNINPQCTIRTYANEDASHLMQPNAMTDQSQSRPIGDVPMSSVWKGSGASSSSDRKLRPAITMDHIANIKCPVTLLSELCTRLDVGSSLPCYTLLLEDGMTGNVCKYVYQVEFANNTYTPPTSSNTVEEAKRIAAQYVIDHIAPWLKSKLEMAVSRPNYMEFCVENSAASHLGSKPPPSNPAYTLDHRRNMDSNIKMPSAYNAAV